MPAAFGTFISELSECKDRIFLLRPVQQHELIQTHGKNPPFLRQLNCHGHAEGDFCEAEVQRPTVQCVVGISAVSFSPGFSPAYRGLFQKPLNRFDGFFRRPSIKPLKRLSEFSRNPDHLVETR
jgi:hypothetical protein